MSCLQQSPDPTWHDYLLAIEDPLDWTKCFEMEDPILLGECIGMSARELAQQDDDEAALEACDALPVGMWRDECFFLVSDALRANGEDAISLCGQAGRYRNPCLGHAIAREADKILVNAERGREDETWMQLMEMVGQHITGREVGSKTRRLMIHHLATRDPDDLFSRTTCGKVMPQICQDAYAERVKLAVYTAQQPEGYWRQACGRDVTPDRVMNLGLPGWSLDVHDLASAAWVELCRR